MPDESWLVYVADVAGKGLSAALMMAALSAKIRSLAPLHDDVSKLLAHVNQEMHALMSEEGFFATIVLSKFWPGTGSVQIARAGQKCRGFTSDCIEAAQAEARNFPCHFKPQLAIFFSSYYVGRKN